MTKVYVDVAVAVIMLASGIALFFHSFTLGGWDFLTTQGAVAGFAVGANYWLDSANKRLNEIEEKS